MGTIYDKFRVKNGKIYLPELLREAAKAKDDEERIKLLKMFCDRGPEYKTLMQYFVELTYHPGVTWALPDGSPPYKENEDAIDPTMAAETLFTAVKKVKYFLNEHYKKVENPIRREQLFVQMLETLEQSEAKLLLMMKDKKVDGRVYKGCNLKLFRTAFPEWLPDSVFEPKKD